MLCIYGKKFGWEIREKELLKMMNGKINRIIIIEEIEMLKEKLEEMSKKKEKIYILPLDERFILELYENEINGMMASKKAVEIFENKKEFEKYIEENGLEKYAPKIYKKEENSNVKIIVKPPLGGGSAEVYIETMKNVKNETLKTYVVQEYIKGDVEFAGYIVAKEGKIVYSFTYYRRYGKEDYIKCLNNDNSEQERCEIDKIYRDILEKFLIPIKYTGICCIDFKLYKNYLKVFEINPRLGASLTYEKNTNDFANIILELIKIY